MFREPTRTAEPQELAPAWHTSALVALILAVSFVGFARMRFAPAAASTASAPAGVAAYLPLVAVQLIMALYVCRVGRAKSALGALVGRRWQSLGRAAGDVAIALALAVGIEVLEIAWATLVGKVASPASLALPRTVSERAVWSVVAVSVGVCEELVYRGYLQTQLTAFTKRPSLGVALQAALFGVAHLDQGAGGALRAGLIGLGFGVVARTRRSLLPTMVCHSGIDVCSGWLSPG